jgi:hypothetical protein
MNALPFLLAQAVACGIYGSPASPGGCVAGDQYLQQLQPGTGQAEPALLVFPTQPQEVEQ